MNQDMYMRQSFRQRPQLSPSVVHSMQLLSMPYTALIPFLSRMTLENPLLELEDSAEDFPLELTEAEDEEIFTKSGSTKEDLPGQECFETERELLRLELLVCGYPGEIEDTALVILDELDVHGYWSGEPEELAARLDIAEETAEKALCAVQSLKPAGTGARSLSECLALQIDESFKNASLIRRLVQEDLPWTAGNHIRQIQKKYGVSASGAREMVSCVRSLNPYPVDLAEKHYGGTYVYPELKVHVKKGETRAALSRRSENLVTVNENYLLDFPQEMLDGETKQFLRECQSHAAELIGSLRLRDRTMERVLKEIAAYQKDFFLYGFSCLKPMTLKQISERLGLSTSTVCRCVQDKYMETDFGVIALKKLFSAQVKAEGAYSSAAAARAAIRSILEQKGEDYSDRELAELLSQQGIHISRRTVTKYRNEEKLSNRSGRRQHGTL